MWQHCFIHSLSLVEIPPLPAPDDHRSTVEMSTFILPGLKCETFSQLFIIPVVNYQTLNIGELLHLLPCDLLRNNVRLIEKLNKRFINAKYGKFFSETCISERLLPKLYIYYIYILV